MVLELQTRLQHSAFHAASKLIALDFCDLQDELGFNMDLLDIGGGFPGSDDTELQFEEVSLLLLSAFKRKPLPPASVVFIFIFFGLERLIFNLFVLLPRSRL